MRYATVEKDKAEGVGINTRGRITSADGTRIVISERDVLYCEKLAGFPSVEERVKFLGGELTGDTEIKLKISKNKWI